uniref:(northern house mosquito) hypothetical protein n=1 Tax=Culex pipiens TaxID=7175 RepID=A0A8D8NJR0_CULPI
MQYAQTYHQQKRRKKPGCSKLKLASKSKTNPEAKQKKNQIETNTPSLVGMNVVNLGEQKSCRVKKEEESKLMRKLKKRQKRAKNLYIKKSITSSSKFLLEV